MDTAVDQVESRLIGSVVESHQHVVLGDITTDTRARAVRAPWWAVVLGVQLLAGSDTVKAAVTAVVGVLS